MTLPSALLDASALLAFLFDEPGAEETSDVIARAAISTVNWVEAAQACLARGASPAAAREALTAVGLQLVPLSTVDAESAAALRADTRELGLSLADRCCIAVAARLGIPAFTADAAWAMADNPAEVVLIR